MFLIGMNVSKQVRSSFIDVLRAFFQPVIVTPLLLAALYAAGEIFLLKQIDWWSVANLKSTILWLITFAFVAMFEVVSIKDEKDGLGKITRDIVTVTSIFLFITELQSFSLLTEIIALPIVMFVVLMAEIAKQKPEHAPVAKMFGGATALIGLGYLGFSLWMTYEKWQETATWTAGLEFMIPIALSSGFLPFLYAWRLYVAYSSTFTTLSVFGIEEKLVHYARWLAITRIGSDLEMLKRWQRAVQSTCPSSKAELEHSLIVLRALKEREADPATVAPKEGWSPYLAMQFMSDVGYDTGHYHHNFDWEWNACSPMREFGNNLIWKNNITYFIEGNEDTATMLKLKLNINDPANAQEAENMFIVGCMHLLEEAVSSNAAERMKMQIARMDVFSEDIPYGTVAMAREDFAGGIEGGYLRKFVIHRGPQWTQSRSSR